MNIKSVKGIYHLKACVLTIVIIALNGCANLMAPTPEQIANADYGLYPSNYKKVVDDYLYTTLKDPMSAQVREIAPIQKSWVAAPFRGVFYGYAACYGVNARNSFGGYTGEKWHYFIINNGRVLLHSSYNDTADIWNQVNRDFTIRLCNGLRG